ncbi:tyrosine-type recombinase/integrase [Salegentibacter salarius]|uniref:Integrase n=1 Tax=Salegentibacter salarius TaxID=435906 RepID=A0A2N0TRI8_9FLAO|nr:tyrosine-type recombinase/integrase [Salegentibacter salarius]OEY71757.1 hypothetical protein BHS39_03570 [Salegentibacter salarius]PKD17350.1 hypothetical protein APR40_03570 [Salegentibacter salarius]SLJ89436.1 Integrase [Salegentibacter salarius]
MASLKFQIQSKSTSAPIYARLSLGRKQVFKRKTGLFISAKDWSKSTGFPKAKDKQGKELKNQLKQLEAFLLEKITKDSAKGIEINSDWVFHNINLHFKRVSDNEGKSELLIDAVQEFIDSAPLRSNSKGGTGLSDSRIKAIKRFKSILQEFLGKRKCKVSEVDLNFAREFSTWLHNKKQFSKSYTLKTIDNLKTICNDAEVNGINVNPQLKNVKGGKVKSETILYLSKTELKKIKEVDLKSKALMNARKWLILGCNIGQRGSDLLNLNESNLGSKGDIVLIELTQQKTGKHVYIPLNRDAKEVIQDGFPTKISMQKFNDYIKLIGKEAEINEKVIAGKVSMVPESKNSDVKIKRKVIKEYEKWEVMASHICRRSFATNLYGELPASLIMSITGHSTEKMFLNYIGKTSVDHIASINAFYNKQDKEQNKEIKLQVISNKAANG